MPVHRSPVTAARAEPRARSLLGPGLRGPPFGIAEMSRRHRPQLHWSGCRQNVELYVHRCDSCAAQKGPTWRSQHQHQLPQTLCGMPESLGIFDQLGGGCVAARGSKGNCTSWCEGDVFCPIMLCVCVGDFFVSVSVCDSLL